MSTAVPAIDPFFETLRDTQWNACVGIQGDELNYLDGYLEAALELVAAVIDKKMMASRDTLAMPILYNARHALELSLKFAIKRLHRIGALGSSHRPDHDIRSHWTLLHDARVGDATIRHLVAELQPFVASLGKIDDDGQELRYAENREGQKSLSEVAVVNLPHIRTSLEAMSRVLRCLKDRVLDFQAERGTGTYTRDCSRSDLREIAVMLGEHASWIDESFANKKDAVRARFCLSSRKFSAAVATIRKSRELAALVGLETPLSYLSDEKAIFALKQWSKVNPKRTADADDLGTNYFERDLEKVLEHRRVAHALDEQIIANLTLEEFSDLEVLFYIGREREFGEHYETMLAETVSKHQLATSRSAGVNHIMSKTSLLEQVIRGSKIAGRPTLAAKLATLRESDR